MKNKKIGEGNIEYYLFAGEHYTRVGDFEQAEKFYNAGLYKQLPGNDRLLKQFNGFLQIKQANEKIALKNPTRVIPSGLVQKSTPMSGVGIARGNAQQSSSSQIYC